MRFSVCFPFAPLILFGLVFSHQGAAQTTAELVDATPPDYNNIDDPLGGRWRIDRVDDLFLTNFTTPNNVTAKLEIYETADNKVSGHTTLPIVDNRGGCP